MAGDLSLCDVNELVCNYSLFADLNSGQTLHITSSDKTSHHYHYVCLNCCLHTADTEGEQIVHWTVGCAFPLIPILR